MSDYPDDDMGRVPGAGTFRIDFNALKEPMVTVPRKAVEAALARLDRIGFVDCANQEEHDEVCRTREAIRSALGDP